MNLYVRLPGWSCVFLSLILWGCSGRTLAPSPNLYVGGGDQGFGEVPEALQNTEVDVLYVTDRAPEMDNDGSLAYGFGRSDSAAFGSAIVHIGTGLTWDELDAASSVAKRGKKVPISLGRVMEAGRFPETPYPRVVTEDGVHVDDPGVLQMRNDARDRLRKEITQRLALGSRKSVLLFVHGFNTDFRNAAETVAELWHLLGRQGLPLLYTWPAGHGGAMGYIYDRESGEFTILHLKNLLRTLSGLPEVQEIQIVAHSRGTDVIVTALRELAIEGHSCGKTRPPSVLFSDLALMAADLDVQLLEQRVVAEDVQQLVGTITIYTSPGDKAIGAAEKLFGSEKRLGRIVSDDLDAEHDTLLQQSGNVYVVQVQAESRGVGHSYFYRDPAVLSDLILLLRDDRLPGSEHGRPLERVSDRFWLLPGDYPGGFSIR